jgi:tetratricopeptide (TPR) repeat protein
MRAFALFAVAALGLAAPLAGQQPSLRQVEALMDAARHAEARQLLEQWSARPPSAEAGLHSQALMLRARLAADPRAAERHYLTLVLDHPMSDEAPEALLRLGQALLILGDTERAAAYLERLSRDYPGNPHRAVGQLWLVRTYRGLGRADDACSLARILLEETPAAAERRPLVEAAAEGACPRVATTGQPAADTPAPAAQATGRFAVQSGAFRQNQGAQALAERLSRAGYEPRLVLVHGSDLLRVRVGQFPTRDAAAALAREIEGRGFAAVVVNDADRERSR